jgi:hypothetical protein
MSRMKSRRRETALIVLLILRTLNQRVEGSSPSTPTTPQKSDVARAWRIAVGGTNRNQIPHSDNLILAHSDKSSDFVPLIRERRFLDPLSF